MKEKSIDEKRHQMFFENSLSLMNDPLFKEMNIYLNVEIPPYFKEFFLKSCEIFNNKNVESPYKFIRNRSTKNDDKYFYKILHESIQNSLSAVLYNLQTFISLTSYVRSKSQHFLTTRPFSPGTLCVPTQKLIFEYEHFMLHSRIVLDRISCWLNYYFDTNSRNVFKLYNELKKNRVKDPMAQIVISTIDKHRAFLEIHISSDKASSRRTERDFIAHKGEIQITNVNIHSIPPALIKVVLYCQDREVEGEADEVLNLRGQSLFRFVKDLLTKFFGVELINTA